MHAIVTDAHLRNAVAGIRGLGRAGVEVTALGPGRAAAGLWSRYAAERETGPDPASDPQGFADALARVAARHSAVAVYPGQETTIEAIVLVRPELPGGAQPDPGALEQLREKRGLPRLAAEHGIRTPTTLFEGSLAELLEADVPLPWVVKPAGPVGGLPTARVVESRADLEELTSELPSTERVLVQERLSGQLVSLALVVDRDGRVVARFQEEALRTWPPEAGSFALTISVAPDDELLERSRSLLAATGYWGLAQLDYVATAGSPILLDVNPRYYACMPLALACGVNLPAAWHAAAEGRPADAPTEYPLGRAYRWLEGDLYAARHGDLRALLRRGPRASAGAMWASDDPLPSAALAVGFATLPIRNRLRRRGRVG